MYVLGPSGSRSPCVCIVLNTRHDKCLDLQISDFHAHLCLITCRQTYLKHFRHQKMIPPYLEPVAANHFR